VDLIKTEVKHHVANNFLEEWNNRPFLNDIEINSLSNEDETKEIIWSCDGKSSEPNEFIFSFLKVTWSIVKSDVCWTSFMNFVIMKFFLKRY
jgi:hypothetical protein